MRFIDRADAGQRLAERLSGLRGADVVVVGLPRGGVPVAAPVAAGLDAPLDVVVVRKLGAPKQRELAMGAIGEGGVQVLDLQMVRSLSVDDEALAEVIDRERAELERRVARYRGGRARVSVAGRTVVIVDDGIATGASAAVAGRVVRALGAERVVIAAPVGPPDVLDRLGSVADEVVVLETPARFGAVGEWYVSFEPTADVEVVALLDRLARPEQF